MQFYCTYFFWNLKILRNGGFSNSENKWFIPFLGADPSVVKRTQYYESMVHGRMPVQYFAYFTMPSLLHVICLMLFGMMLFVLTKFSFGIKLLEKVRVIELSWFQM